MRVRTVGDELIDPEPDVEPDAAPDAEPDVEPDVDAVTAPSVFGVA